jgi:integrase
MGRPRTPVGTHGKIRTIKLGDGPTTWRSICRFRDHDGKYRLVQRDRTTKNKAETALLVALRDRGRLAPTDSEVTRTTPLSEVAAQWLTELAESGKATRTKQTYAETWTRDLRPVVAELTVGELTVAAASRTLRAIRDHAGQGSAIHARTVLTHVVAVAVRHGALDRNVVRDVVLGDGKPKGKGDDTEGYVLEPEHVPRLHSFLQGSDYARGKDLPDLCDFLSGTGLRIGEALAVRWSEVDFASGTVEINGKMIRIPGEGLIREDYTKSKAGMRTLRVPKWTMKLLTRRRESATSDYMFPTPGTERPRDPDVCRKHLRDATEGSEWQGLHPHSFRHVVSTRLELSGLSSLEIADYLGHGDLRSQADYKIRGLSSSKPAAALEDLAPE